MGEPLSVTDQNARDHNREKKGLAGSLALTLGDLLPVPSHGTPGEG